MRFRAIIFFLSVNRTAPFKAPTWLIILQEGSTGGSMGNMEAEEVEEAKEVEEEGSR
jgi:hypothetical protein